MKAGLKADVLKMQRINLARYFNQVVRIEWHNVIEK